MAWTDLLSTIIGTGAAAAGGGIFGLVGSLAGAWTKMRQAKQEHEFIKDKWAYETELQKLNMQAKAEENEQAIALSSSQGSWASLQASVATERKAGESYRWVNAVKDLFRPVLTAGLFALTYLVFLDIVRPDGVIQTMLAAKEIIDLVRYIVYSVVFAATTSGVWWFGDRAFSPPGMKNR
jgi:uncharacterized membrane protein YraQ (UPF0718 family)